jgi:hypothetical protein
MVWIRDVEGGRGTKEIVVAAVGFREASSILSASMFLNTGVCDNTGSGLSARGPPCEAGGRSLEAWALFRFRAEGGVGVALHADWCWIPFARRATASVGVCRKKREANNYSRLKMREPLVCSLSFSYSIAFICSIYCKDCVDLTEKYVSKEIEMKRSAIKLQNMPSVC